MKETLLADLSDAAAVLRSFLGESKPTCAVVLGSGLGPFAATLSNARSIDYRSIPHMSTSTATGHVGRFVLGQTQQGKTLLCMQGRLHGYEGLSAHQVAFPVWLMHECGIDVLLTTNAAGAINPNFQVGDFCIMSDHINLTGRNPLVGVEPNKMAQRFVPLNDCYDFKLRQIAKTVAQDAGISIQEGVYLALLGPSFETPAEIRAFAHLGADTVAMSVVEEVIAARHVGMRVLGMSLITNMAAGIEGAVPSDAEVHEVAFDRIAAFTTIVNGVVASCA